MKKELNLSMMITIATILISVGGSYGVLQSKTQEFDKAKEKIDDTEKKVIAMAVNLENIKESQKEIQADLKELIRKIR